ncbi:MAG: glycoside hydrolase family 15 protein [Candidatus Limnocylindria bacterium]
MPGGAFDGSAFPPISDYAFLSDCENSVLVAPSGKVEWLCLPRMDSPSVFGSILDRTAGGFRFGPGDVRVPAARRYLPGTMVLETSWGTPQGWVIIRDVLLIGPWRHEDERSESQARAPTDYDAEHILLRMVRCVNGEMQLTLDCEPVFDYGRRIGEWEFADRTYKQVVCRDPDADLALTLTSDINLGFEGPRAIGRTLIKEGETRFVALSWGLNEPPRTTDEAYKRLVWTAHHWQHWLARGTFPDHPWRASLERSALTLKGLMYAPTGAVLAAPTTSLPEAPGGERNWDYRYSWIRDSTFALWGLYTLGFDWEANDYLYFIADVAERYDELPIMTTLDGGPVPQEQILGHLRGYEGAQPVRIGNGAFGQRQHDVWGAVLDSVFLHTKSRDHLDERIWPIMVKQVEAALDAWRKPDRGMWEVRGDPKHFTSSKLMCWVAADRGAQLAEIRDDSERVARWRAAADEIKEDICANGLDKRGVFTQHYETDALDASVLLMPLVRFLPPEDDRIRRTVLAIANELTVDGLVLRYRTQETDDGLAGEEGAFLICSFWLVSALVEIGEVKRARRLCEKLLALASPLDLYGEEIEPETGRHLGNFPQAFTHLALINAVMHVIEAEKGEGMRAAPLSPRMSTESRRPA